MLGLYYLFLLLSAIQRAHGFGGAFSFPIVIVILISHISFVIPIFILFVCNYAFFIIFVPNPIIFMFNSLFEEIEIFIVPLKFNQVILCIERVISTDGGDAVS